MEALGGKLLSVLPVNVAAAGWLCNASVWEPGDKACKLSCKEQFGIKIVRKRTGSLLNCSELVIEDHVELRGYVSSLWVENYWYIS